MHLRTRNLMTLLGDPTTDAILSELRDGPRTEEQLVAESPTGRTATRVCLSGLVDLEVVSSEKSPPSAGRPGARRNLFRVTEPELFRFCDEADRFALRLAEAQTDRLRRHVEGLP